MDEKMAQQFRHPTGGLTPTRHPIRTGRPRRARRNARRRTSGRGGGARAARARPGARCLPNPRTMTPPGGSQIRGGFFFGLSGGFDVSTNGRASLSQKLGLKENCFLQQGVVVIFDITRNRFWWLQWPHGFFSSNPGTC